MSFQLVPKSLHYLEQVAQLGSIQAASRKLGVSASAIHRQIRTIEEALGEELFERTVKGMTPTLSGQFILDLARDWRLDTARLWALIQANRGTEQGHIRIAAMDGMVNGFVLELVGEIARLYPRVHVDIEITSPGGAAKGVLNGDYDIAAVANVGPHEDLKFHWSREFPLGCIATPGHPVSARERISLSEFVTHPVVFQDQSLSIRRLLEARHGWIFERAANAVTVNSIQLMKLLVLSGRYVALTSELDAGPELRDGRLKFIPISDRDTFRQTISLVSNTLIPESSATRKIILVAAQLLERLTAPGAP